MTVTRKESNPYTSVGIIFKLLEWLQGMASLNNGEEISLDMLFLCFENCDDNKAARRICFASQTNGLQHIDLFCALNN